MFADGNRQLVAVLSALELPADPRAALKTALKAFADFAVSDAARYSLLFTRSFPDSSRVPRRMRSRRTS